jgi:hypothetical protein
MHIVQKSVLVIERDPEEAHCKGFFSGSDCCASSIAILAFLIRDSGEFSDRLLASCACTKDISKGICTASFLR